MHQISKVLDWPTVQDLYPHVGMAADWSKGCTSPAKPRRAKSLAAPAMEQGGCTPSSRPAPLTAARSLPKSAQGRSL